MDASTVGFCISWMQPTSGRFDAQRRGSKADIDFHFHQV